jgi:sRNA-binding protein
VTAGICRHWIGTDMNGHICGAAVKALNLCAKHYELAKARMQRELDARQARHDRQEAAWRERNARKAPAWRAQLEQAEREYARRTQSVVADRAAVGGAMHPSIVRAQRSVLADSNVARVVELERIIGRLKSALARLKGGAS